MSPESINLLGAIAAIFSALFALMALASSHFQAQVKKYEIKRDYQNTILNWFSETTRILIELRTILVHSPTEYKLKRFDLLSKLSSQIEIGRLYFPNIDKKDGFGKEKPKAFQGYRNLTLDFLVYSYNLFSQEDAYKYEGHLVRLQREYTSIICEIVDPKEFLNETKKHSNKFFAYNLSYNDFLSQNPENIDLFFPKRNK